MIHEAQASATIEAAWAAGIGYFDTSPWYGAGKSEQRFGHVLRSKPRETLRAEHQGRAGALPPARPGRASPHRSWAGGLPFELRFDYTRDGVLRSYEDSLQRLGMNRVDALLIHDLDLLHHGSEAGVEARLRELDGGRRLRGARGAEGARRDRGDRRRASTSPG